MSMELREEAGRRERERLEIRKRHQQFAGDLHAVASRPEGARLLARLLDHGGLFRPGHTEGEAGAYLAGKKAAALDLWHSLRQCLPRDLFVDIALGGADSPELRAAEEPGTEFDETSFD